MSEPAKNPDPKATAATQNKSLLGRIFSKDIVSDVIIAGSVEIGLNWVKSFMMKAAEKHGGKVAEKSLEQSRPEMIAFLRKLASESDGDYASKNVFRHIADRNKRVRRSYGSHEPYQHGDEAKLVNLLTDFYRYLDNEAEDNDRYEMFKWLGHLPDAYFDAIIESLDHDQLAQWWRLGVEHLTITLNFVSERMERNPLFQRPARQTSTGVFGRIWRKL